jgi:hypothetical protein
MQIVVKVPMAGKTFEIDIDSDDTIKSIKELIEDRERMPPKSGRLIFDGKLMDITKSAQDYNLEGGSEIILMDRPTYSSLVAMCIPAEGLHPLGPLVATNTQNTTGDAAGDPPAATAAAATASRSPPSFWRPRKG